MGYIHFGYFCQNCRFTKTSFSKIFTVICFRRLCKAIAKKTPNSFVVSVRLSVHIIIATHTGRILAKYDIREFY
jgi:hypothetical protein